MMPDLIGVIREELVRMGDSGPSPVEVARSKAQLKAGLLMSLESSSARAEQMARHILVHGRVIPAAELVSKVEAISPAEVRDLAARLFAGRPAAAVVGAGKRSADLATSAAGAFSS
jgi:predicted Zn-dependent peptidase